MQPYIANLVKTNFPYQRIKYCFAYGSSLHKLSIDDKEQKVIDLILVVDDTYKFHSENIRSFKAEDNTTSSMKTNRKHYSFLGTYAMLLFAILEKFSIEGEFN